MAYVTKVWVDGRTGGTPVTAVALNDLEDRIETGIGSGTGGGGGGGPSIVSPGPVTTNQTLDMTPYQEVLWVVTAGANVKLEIGGWTTGKAVMLIVKQDATGGRSVTLPTCKWDTGAIPAGSTGANAIDVRSFVRGTTETYGFESGTGMA